MNLKRVFIRWSLLMAFLVVLWVIFGPKGKKIDFTEVNFGTTSSAQLYFKNIRAYFYEIEERADASYNLYRIKSRTKSDSLLVQAVIIQNWMYDESYVLFENQFNKPIDTAFSFFCETDSGLVEIVCPSYSTKNHFKTAADLYFYLSKEEQLYFNGKPLDNQSQTALRITLSDYFKLVGKLR